MLPASRNTTYAASSPVLSEDLNDIQDAIVARAHGDLVDDYLPIGIYSANVAFDSTNLYAASTGAGTVVIPLVYPVGTTLKSVTWAKFGTGACLIEMNLVKLSAAGAAGGLGAIGNSTPAAAWSDQTVDFADQTIAAGDAWALRCSFSATGGRLGTVRLTYAKPL